MSFNKVGTHFCAVNRSFPGELPKKKPTSPKGEQPAELCTVKTDEKESSIKGRSSLSRVAAGGPKKLQALRSLKQTLQVKVGTRFCAVKRKQPAGLRTVNTDEKDQRRGSLSNSETFFGCSRHRRQETVSRNLQKLGRKSGQLQNASPVTLCQVSEEQPATSCR